MMKRSSLHPMYATLPFGLFISILIYIGNFFIFDRLGNAMPSGLWWVGVPLLLIGILFQYISTRVLWIRLYQAGICFLAGLNNVVALWLLIYPKPVELSTQLVAMILILIFFLCTYGSYHLTMDRYKTESYIMPHGTVGTISTNTGIINTELTPQRIEKRNLNNTNTYSIWSKFSPIAIGLAFFVMRTYGLAGKLMIAAVVALLLTVLGAILAGMLMVYVVSIIRWERRHQRHLHLQY